MAETSIPTAAPRGTHFDFLKARLPSWFTQASSQRQQELSEHQLQLPAWYTRATSATRAALAARHNLYRDTLNTIETRLGAIQDIAEFAEPLLKARIKQQFNLDVDVRQVYFARKYTPASPGVFASFVDVDQTREGSLNDYYRGFSLLETALANFESSEEAPLRCADCQIITTWGSYDDEVIPTFTVLKDHAVAIPPHEFARLCRSLDLGAQYQTHIKEQVQPADAAKRSALEQALEQHKREQLALSIQLAALQGHISPDVRSMLEQLLADPARVELDGKPVTLTAISLFGSELVGPLLIGPDRKSSKRKERVVVYVPNDPQQPLKEYADSGEFMADLRTRLHSASYRRFFSRFIPVREQGAFFRSFNTLYRPADRSDSNSDYPLKASLPRLPVQEAKIIGSPWEQLRQAHVRKLLADARAVAVPTDDEDRAARLDRLFGYFDAVVNVFNLAAFVVPSLGPLMLVVGAAQIFDEAFEGIESFEQGETREMWAHLSSVAMNVAAAGTGAVVLPHVRLSSLVDGLQPVKLADGAQKLWRRDLAPYKAPVTLPAGAQPDQLGLYSHAGHSVLPLEGEHYRVRQDPQTGEYRIRHPSRAGAYEPRLTHNGEGAWQHELERPRTWHGARLMRRLGPVIDGFSDAELEQIRQVSGVDEAVLRRVHVDSTPAPAILLDTVRQFRAHAGAVQVADGIGAGALSDTLCSYAASLAVELPRWPADRAIEAFAGTGLSGPSVKYGNADALPRHTLSVDRADLMAGKLPERIVDFLDDAQMDQLVGSYTARDRAVRIAAVKDRLQALANTMRARLMRSVYADQQPATSVAERLVQRDFKSLPTLMVREMLADASAAERQVLDQGVRIPLRLAEQARRLQQQMRLVHAYEGLHLEALANEDTEALVLNTLPNLPGWSDNLRLEVREGELEGELRASFGPESAEKKILVRKAEARYQAFDDRGQELHGINGLYGALQHALPDAHRKAIGLAHVGQGEQLKSLILDKALPREQLRSVLGMRSARQSFFQWPLRLPDNRLGYPLSGRGPGGALRRSIEERVRDLYDTINDEEMTEFLDGRDLNDDSWLVALEQEYRTLDRVLNSWMTQVRPGERARLKARRSIYEAITHAWKKSGNRDFDASNTYRGQRIKLSNPSLGAELATLPALPGNFDHVTSLSLADCGLTDASMGFLSNFRRLRLLRLEGNQLTQLPPSVPKLVWLEGLYLADNNIALTADSALGIKNMTRLIALALDGNPLSMPVDISRMPQLRWLHLYGCGLQEWPVGIFRVPRPADFYMDLRNNPLSRIPSVAPGSDRANIIARTVTTRDRLTPEVLDTFKLYLESVGLDPERRFALRGLEDSRFWLNQVGEQRWSALKAIWDGVEAEIGSEPFFDELRKLSNSSDARNPKYLPGLTEKVWRVLSEMARNTELRDRLFTMATASSSCVDAIAQIFNTMGFEVLLSEALSLPEGALQRLELLELAKGKVRLEKLSEIANRKIKALLDQGHQYMEFDEQGLLITRRDAQGNPLVGIDPVEIHLAYSVELAPRLDLPWQSESMQFSAPEVTPEDIEAAYQSIRALDEGNLMRDAMVELRFWENYLKVSFGDEFNRFAVKSDALIDLQSAQRTLADNGRLSTEEKADLRMKISESEKLLGKTSAQMVKGEVMSDDEYDIQVALLGDEYKTLLHRLTDQVMGRGLPPVEAR
ncbi:hypothetical protein HX893_14130 [Pseudomonas reactans]|uniref:RING-type E3 ubiquitin transferase n=1 Tax=Pseudomonas reactans TaxID=117680 RepID=A0A7Y8G217_9PSED|nr:DUF6543 domain-containing protein [Pseudomonas reactans]NWE89265.1 hypothetical protein [Pseudomonas reactans]